MVDGWVRGPMAGQSPGTFPATFPATFFFDRFAPNIRFSRFGGLVLVPFVFQLLF